METAALLRRARAREPEAVAELFRRALPHVREMARARLGPRNALRASLDSEDLLQEALLRAWRALDQAAFDGFAAFAGWLARIVENTLHDAARAEARLKRGADRRLSADEAVFLSQVPTMDPTPSQVRMGAELAERALAALAAMDERQREAILLRRNLGCSFAEIAARLGLAGVAQARTLLSRALAELARRLDEPRA
jgi:RNA polymerase sigma-70 factor (ECF subfamily)